MVIAHLRLGYKRHILKRRKAGGRRECRHWVTSVEGMIGDSELEFEEKLLMNACTALQLSKVIDRLSTFSFQIFPPISE